MGFFNNFPYSNFHELNLDWIIGEIKNTVKTVYEYGKKVDDNSNKVAELEKYVMDYFNNLNVSEEVSKKLDEMQKDGSLAAIISEIMTGYVNVKTFGAVGDGVSDDSHAFNLAIKAGNNIAIPEGVYLVNNIEIPDNTTLYGLGMARRVVLKMADATHGCIFTNYNKIDGNNIVIKDLTINGNSDGQNYVPGDSDSCLFMYNASNIRIENVSIDRPHFSGIFIQRGTGHRVENCVVRAAEYNSGFIITSESEMNSVIDGCVSNENEKDGFCVTGAKIVVKNCFADYNGRQRHNDLKDEPSCGIYLDRKSAYCIIKNNVLTRNSFAGIENKNANFVLISENQIVDNNLVGIFCNGNFCCVSGNILVNNPKNDQPVAESVKNERYSSIYIGDFTQDGEIFNSVNGNVINGNGLYGIFVEDGFNTLIGNSINGVSLERVKVITDSISINYDTDGYLPLRGVANGKGSFTWPSIRASEELDSSKLLLPLDGSTTERSLFLSESGLHVYYNGGLHNINFD